MKKNGFTLIELLAVIVILAIIAVITVPVVLNAIGTARGGSETESARGFVKAAEFYCASQLLTTPPTTISTLKTTTGVNFKGTAPTAVDITFNTANCVASGTVTYGTNVYTIGTNI